VRKITTGLLGLSKAGAGAKEAAPANHHRYSHTFCSFEVVRLASRRQSEHLSAGGSRSGRLRAKTEQHGLVPADQLARRSPLPGDRDESAWALAGNRGGSFTQSLCAQVGEA
jgi:hypothetical protein